MIQDVFLQYAWWEDLGAYLFYTIYFLISHEVFLRLFEFADQRRNA